MSLSSIAAVQSRIASIETRLGVDAARGTDARSRGTSFDDVFRAHASSPTSSPGVIGAAGTRSLSDVPFADLFRTAGERYGVDPALLAAVAETESGFDPNAVSHAGAQGLMQLMPATAAGLGVSDSFDPRQAVDGAARLLAGHLETFGSTELALAAYNAGGGAVRRFGGIPPYAETQSYVPKVMQRFQELTR